MAGLRGKVEPDYIARVRYIDGHLPLLLALGRAEVGGFVAVLFCDAFYEIVEIVGFLANGLNYDSAGFFADIDNFVEV